MKKIIIKLRAYLITGLIVVGPIILTILIIMWLLNLVDSLFIMILNILPYDYLPKIMFAPGIGVIVVLIFLIFTGIIGKNFLGKLFIYTSDKVFNKLPIVKFIYGTIKQIFDTIFSNHGKSFKSVVLVEFPKKDSWSIGFITSDVEDKKLNKPLAKKHSNKEEFVSVFIPTTPNPTSGFLMYVLKSNTIKLDISANVAMKIIISGGIISSSDIDSHNNINK